ncbi:MAG TPA: hypothetical protein VN112_11935 [Ensifer sp.]|nr:hypothetical protein [Ensifer sp.]
MTIKRTILISLTCLSFALPAKAAPTTATGEISVAQVIDLIKRSPTDNAARNAAVAYLAGVGETTGLLMEKASGRPQGGMACARSLGISGEAALAALSRTDKAIWEQTAATPILVNDMLNRAGCR